jgi:hypothetical protein
MTIMKQLIEGMIGNYLNESVEDDLIESIFEEVSGETWEAIEEAILNELSPETLASYTKKASKWKADKDHEVISKPTKQAWHSNSERRQVKNRRHGMETAMKKLGATHKDMKTHKDLDSKVTHAARGTGTLNRSRRMARKYGDEYNARASQARKDFDDHVDTMKQSKTTKDKNRDAKELSAADFERKHHMSKSEWKQKSKS